MSVAAAVSKCRTCLGSGISNAQLITRPDGELTVATYLREGVACTCGLGVAFMAQQMRYLHQGEQKTWRRQYAGASEPEESN